MSVAFRKRAAAALHSPTVCLLAPDVHRSFREEAVWATCPGDLSPVNQKLLDLAEIELDWGERLPAEVWNETLDNTAASATTALSSQIIESIKARHIERWPAGTPGGLGGQFKPLSGAIGDVRASLNKRQKTILGNITTYLSQIRAMRTHGLTPEQQQRPYIGPEDLILKEGRVFSHYANDDPSHDMYCTPQRCFTNALMIAVRDRHRTYVEGYAMKPDGMIPIHHAWTVDEKGGIYDPTWGHSPDAVYVGVPFQTDYLTKTVLSRGYDTLITEDFPYDKPVTQRQVVPGLGDPLPSKTLPDADRLVQEIGRALQPNVAGRSWEGFPFNQRTGQGPKPTDTPPERTTTGDFIVYHGTSEKAAKKIMRQQRIRPDDLQHVGIATIPGQAQTYAVMAATRDKDKERGGVILKVVLDKEWLANQQISREGGGSGHDQFLIEPPIRMTDWNGVPPMAIKHVSVLDFDKYKEEGGKSLFEVEPYMREGRPVSGYLRELRDKVPPRFPPGFWHPDKELVYEAAQPALARNSTGIIGGGDGITWKAIINRDTGQAKIWTTDSHYQPSHQLVSEALGWRPENGLIAIAGAGAGNKAEIDYGAIMYDWDFTNMANRPLTDDEKNQGLELAWRHAKALREWEKIAGAGKGAKAQVHVRPYIREGHPVLGYIREEGAPELDERQQRTFDGILYPLDDSLLFMARKPYVKLVNGREQPFWKAIWYPAEDDFKLWFPRKNGDPHHADIRQLFSHEKDYYHSDEGINLADYGPDFDLVNASEPDKFPFDWLIMDIKDEMKTNPSEWGYYGDEMPTDSELDDAAVEYIQDRIRSHLRGFRRDMDDAVALAQGGKSLDDYAVKRQVRVKPYIREGRPVEGYIRDLATEVLGDGWSFNTTGMPDPDFSAMKEKLSKGETEIDPYELAAAFHGLGKGDVRIRIDTVEPWGTGTRIRGHFTTPELDTSQGGEMLAFARRFMSFDIAVTPGRISANDMFLPHDHQSAGIGSALMRYIEAWGRDHGQQRVDLTAAHVGSYAWARAGYDLKFPGAPACSQLGYDAESILERQVYENGIEIPDSVPESVLQDFIDHFASEEEVTDAYDAFYNAHSNLTSEQLDEFPDEQRQAFIDKGIPAYKFRHVIEIAEFGRDHPWEDPNYGKVWIGKAWLIGRKWDGTKEITGVQQKSLPAPMLNTLYDNWCRYMEAHNAPSFGEVAPDGPNFFADDDLFWNAYDALSEQYARDIGKIPPAGSKRIQVRPYARDGHIVGGYTREGNPLVHTGHIGFWHDGSPITTVENAIKHHLQEVGQTIHEAIGVDIHDIDFHKLHQHAWDEAHEPVSRSKLKSPCWLSPKVDFSVHRVLPAMLQEHHPALAAQLRKTSPRWGWRSQGLPHQAPTWGFRHDDGKRIHIEPYIREGRIVEGYWRDVEPSMPDPHAPYIRRRLPDGFIEAYDSRQSLLSAISLRNNIAYGISERHGDRPDLLDASPEYQSAQAEVTRLERVTGELEDKIGGRVYRLNESQLPKAEKKMGQLQKAAEKIGLPPPKLHIVGEEYVEANKPHVPRGQGEQRHYLYIQVTGSEPKIEGWQFIATLQHLPDGVNVIRRVPGSDDSINIDKYRDGEARCDYCHTLRDRNDTFLLVNDAGKIQQVGRNCLRDFLGHGNPAQMVGYLENWIAFDNFDLPEDEEDDGGDRASRPKTYVPTLAYLTHVATMIRTEGWVGRSARHVGLPTADAARTNYFAWINQEKDRAGRPLWETPTEEDQKKAQDALTWLREVVANKPNKTEFDHNMSALAQGDYMPDRGEGILAYSLVAHAKAQQREIQMRQREQAAAKSEHIGTVGERMKLKLTVEMVWARPGNYGVTYITKFTDEHGNIVKWFGSYELTQGATYEATWTIKKHDEFKGAKETVITRPHKLAEVGGDGEHEYRKGDRVMVGTSEGVVHSVDPEHNRLKVQFHGPDEEPMIFRFSEVKPVESKKSAVEVHPYFREGHVVAGYTRHLPDWLRGAPDLPNPENYTGEPLVPPAAFRDFLHGYHHGKLTVGLQQINVRYGGVFTESKIFDSETHQPVGVIHVNIVNRPGGGKRLYLDLLSIQKTHQNAGFAHQFVSDMEDFARSHGVQEHALEAVGIGGYAWARAGFRFTNGARGAEDILDSAVEISLRSRHLNRSGIEIPETVTDADIEDFISRFPKFEDLPYPERMKGKFTSEIDIASYGRDKQWLDNGHKMWLGKAFMLKRSWTGVKDLLGAKAVDEQAVARIYDKWASAQPDSAPTLADLGDDGGLYFDDGNFWDLLDKAKLLDQKSQVHVRPYFREGHPVVGYEREQELARHVTVEHSIRDAIELPKTGKLREYGERALEAVDKVLALPEMPRIPLRTTAGKNKRGGYINRQVGDIEVEKWDGPTVRLANMRPANRPAKRADEFQPGDTILQSSGYRQRVLSVGEEPAPGPFGRPKEDGSKVVVLRLVRINSEDDSPWGDEFEHKYKPDELLAFPWEPRVTGTSKFQPKEIRATVQPNAEDKDGAPAPFTPDEVLIHEIGHYIDNYLLGGAPDGHDYGSEIARFQSYPDQEIGDYLRSAREKDPEIADKIERWISSPSALAGWWKAIQGTRAVQELRTVDSLMDQGTHKYMLKPVELFARSFSQWIAMRSGDPKMIGQIREWQNTPLKYKRQVENYLGQKVEFETDMPRRIRFAQWQDDDFAPVAFEFDRLFQKLGWLKPTAVGVTVG